MSPLLTLVFCFILGLAARAVIIPTILGCVIGTVRYLRKDHGAEAIAKMAAECEAHKRYARGERVK